jgi:hypothetical protein
LLLGGLCLDTNFGCYLDDELFYEYCDADNMMYESSMDEDEDSSPEEDAWNQKQMSNGGMMLREMYCHVMQYAERLSSSNTIVCPQCMIAGHF